MIRPFNRRRVTTLLPLLLLAMTACADAGGEAAAPFAIRDSAGIRIAESSAPAWGPGEAWRLADAPALEIGLADGAPEYLLSRVTSALRRSDGTIMLVNAGSQEVRFYDSEGEHIRSVGGQGGGPGEFQRLLSVMPIRGDTLLAYDLPAQRVSTLAPDGTFLRAVTLDGLETFPEVHSAFVDGSLVIRTRRFEGLQDTGSGMVTDYATFLHLSPTGELLDTLHHAAPETSYQMTRTLPGGVQAVAMVRELFGASTIAAAAGDSLFVGRNDRFELTILSPDGEVRGIVRYLVEPRPVTDEILQAARQARLAEAEERGSDGPGPLDEALGERPHGETVPFFMRAMVDRSGNLWLQEYVPPGAEELPGWMVFNPEGRLLGSLQMPEGFTPRYIDEEFVLGVARDDFSVERVRMYALEKL